MMTKNLKNMGVVALTILLTTACVPHKKSPIPASSGEFSSCVAEATTLVKINRVKYEKDYTNLSTMIKATKDYAGIINHIQSDNQSIITPLYQYKINNVCNEISQKLLAEMKVKALEIQSQ
ncbi:hypothetical protein [Buttiauxella sp. A111]|uniref:hypothetical protein n=1 Tax=Buttiauxella sp. A111 TaxID=2563088 RepID=UPI0010CF73E8|nr:hypothetical protein [Buttiauxella sp. A111]GDX05309.1 hypothetical protein BSPA111_15000 [Buttiauxella sp. A111]